MRALAVFRSARFLVCILLCVCMAFACVAPIYAAAVLPVVVFSSLAVIAAVLVATGVMSSNDANFDGLCNDIYDGLSAASKIGPKITLSVLSGISYLHTSIVELITAEAVKQGVYSPSAGQSMIEVDGYSYPYYANEAAAQADFVPIVSVTEAWFSHTDGETQTIPTTAPYHWAITYGFSHSTEIRDETGAMFCSMPLWCPVTTGEFRDVQFGSVVFLEDRQRLAALIVSLNRFRGIVFLREPTAIGSICVRFPWELTDDLPSISSSGVLDRVNAGWLARERAIDGTASLPLSVPADTVAGAAAQTQTEAQAGAKTEGAGGGEESMDKNKGKITLLPLLKCFPFSLPWDVVAGFQMLSAAEVKPIFEIPFKMNYGGVVVDESIQLDLTKFDAVFQIARALELLAFGIGLAIFTKKIIWG